MPRFEYSEYDGSQAFLPFSAAGAFDKLAEFLLEYGERAMDLLDYLDEDQADVLEQLVKEGYLERDKKGRYRVSPKGLKRVEQKAIDELFARMKRDTLGKHETRSRGPGQVVHEESKPYEYGDPVANLNLHETLKNAILRQGGGTPVHVGEDDFVVYDTEYQTACATVVLLDMSGSMARYGKFYHAKKVCLALQAMVAARFPEDFFQVIGFYTYATPMRARELLAAAPKEVSIFDSRVHLRIDLDHPPRWVPQHFTNIHAGLKLARRTLARQACQNKQIIIVTDGEPTAHVEGREVVLIYPPSQKTARATLAEALRCSQEGIHVSSFALVEDYYYLNLVNFVDQMARASKGIAAYCTAGQLGKFVLDSFVGGRKTRRVVG